MVLIWRNQVPTSLPQAETLDSTRSGCSEPHPILPWTPQRQADEERRVRRVRGNCSEPQEDPLLQDDPCATKWWWTLQLLLAICTSVKSWQLRGELVLHTTSTWTCSWRYYTGCDTYAHTLCAGDSYSEKLSQSLLSPKLHFLCEVAFVILKS